MPITKTTSWEIVTNQDVMEVIGNEPDPNWRYTDNKGHRHQWKKRSGSWHVTNSKLVEYTYSISDYCECCGAETEGEEQVGYRLVCARCGERLYPGHKREQKHIAGRPETTGTFTTTEKYYRIPMGKKYFRLQSWLPPKGGVQLCGKGFVTAIDPSVPCDGELAHEVQFTVIGQVTAKAE